MAAINKAAVLKAAEKWIVDDFHTRNLKNIKKLSDINEFTINPILLKYLSRVYHGKHNPECLVRTLIAPRILSTSVTTTFGNRIKPFIISNFPDVSKSLLHGVDIEFLDKSKKNPTSGYCKIFAGPHTLNSTTSQNVIENFNNLISKKKLKKSDLFIGVTYGEDKELSENYLKIRSKGYKIVCGQDFWNMLTGHKSFYDDLIKSFKSGVDKIDETALINKIISDLKKDNKIKRY